MYEMIVFDLDGTLLNTLDDLWAAVNAALGKYNLPLRTKEEVRNFIGNGIVKLMQRAVGYEHPNFDGILMEFKTYYGEHCADKTQPYDGIMSLLETLQSKKIKLAVLSNKADFAVKMLAESYFKGIFDAAVGENEAAGIRKKPAPDSLIAVMQQFNVAKEKTLYVGDSEVDIQTANNAGVACLSVTWGFKDEKFLLENGATQLAHSPHEILCVCGE